ncbi:hypothetical protein B0H13DRAFT_2307937 [Mycena leptocephala]|nr:hypothetical protein B0H13DRAFT_2307937 [Mycena leptocephala]
MDSETIKSRHMSHTPAVLNGTAPGYAYLPQSNWKRIPTAGRMIVIGLGYQAMQIFGMTTYIIWSLILFQDSQLTRRLVANGTRLTSSRSKHPSSRIGAMEVMARKYRSKFEQQRKYAFCRREY